MALFKKNVWAGLRQSLSGRGVTPTMLTALDALSDKTWIDEVVAVLKKHATANGEQLVANITKIETNHEAARAIMGTNFLGLAEIEKAFGVKFTPAQRQKLAIIPDKIFKVLNTCAKTHVLVAGFPLSINDVRAKVADNPKNLFCSPTGTGWYNDQPFAGVQVECRWYLLRKEPIANSTSKSYDDQLKLIPEGEENPWARDVVFAVMALFLTTGERLFERIYVRCKDVTSSGSRVFLGCFDRGGLSFISWLDEPGGSVAVVSLRNS